MLAKELKEKLATIADDVQVQLCIEDTVEPGFVYLGTSKIIIADKGDFALLTSILDYKTSDDWNMED